MPRFKIVIKNVQKPSEEKTKEEFLWLCKSLGLLEPIDKQKIASSILKEVFKSPEPLTSNDIAEKVQMSRGSVVNHLNKLQTSGIIIKSGRTYIPRERSMEKIIEEMEKDVLRIFSDLKRISKEIDDDKSAL